uniref:Uncharacterized protein n=1 Tax=Ascaris lumbricoides TaxID=6252 RepID=A0A0M3IC85_ASCLU
MTAADPYYRLLLMSRISPEFAEISFCRFRLETVPHWESSSNLVPDRRLCSPL